MNAPGVDKSNLAPNLQMASTPPAPRLDQRLDPAARRVDAGDAHADELPEGRRRQAHVASRRAWLDAPAFAKDREEFARLLGGDEQAKKFLSDPDAVTKALRDYVWSIGINGGTAPAPAARRARAVGRGAFGAAGRRPASPAGTR